LRHFLFTWLKTHGIDDALIQPYSGHASRTSLEIHSKIALGCAQDAAAVQRAEEVKPGDLEQHRTGAPLHGGSA
jgi:hypothetical protein